MNSFSRSVLLSSLTLALVHCTSEGGASPSAADASVEAEIQEATIELGAEYSGITIVSTAPDGRFIASGITDQNGTATIPSQAGGMVSVLRLGYVYSFIHVGDSPTFRLDAPWWAEAAVGQLRFDVQPVDDAAAYFLEGCSDQMFSFDAEPMHLTFSEECSERGALTVYGFAGDFGSTLYAYAAHTIAPDERDQELELEWKTDFREHSLPKLLFPNEAQTVRTSALAEVDGRLFQLQSTRREVDAVAIVTPPYIDALTTIQLQPLYDDSRSSSYWGPVASKVEWLMPATEFVVEHESGGRPWLRWEEGPDADFLKASYSVFIDSSSLYWEVLAPASTTEVSFPEIPLELLPGLPSLSGELLYGFGSVEHYEFGDAHGYEDAMATGVASRAVDAGALFEHLRDTEGHVLSASTAWLAE